MVARALPVRAVPVTLRASVPPILTSIWSSVSALIVVSASASRMTPSDNPLTSTYDASVLGTAPLVCIA